MTPQSLPPLQRRKFDLLVIGAGGAGLRAALSCVEGEVAVVSKVFPLRSHTVAAQGGINAALANVSEDRWQWHMYDTVKGGDWLGDQDAIEFMCRSAARVVYELEHAGLPFSRLENGRIYQRPFGGQSRDFGGEQAVRTCAAADRTGHAMLHTLYQQNIRARTHFFDEFFAVDLLRDDQGYLLGALLLEIATGTPLLIEAKATLIATGGAGQIFRTNTNARINTGDGAAMAVRAGIPLQDMEFFQFHPTGIAGKGLLISEGVRGEGGYLVNGHGQRFMDRYAPKAGDLASRDVVSRAIATEIQEGRGCGATGDHVLLKLDHLGAEVITKRLPGIREMCLTFLHLDPVRHPIPVAPTAHYLMGGIPTNRFAEVVAPLQRGEEVVPGLYAVGECACVSVHGANRLGGNSLLDLVVFGHAAGESIGRFLREQRFHRPLAEGLVDRAMARLQRWERRGAGEGVEAVRRDLQGVMERHCGMFREESLLQQGRARLLEIRERIDSLSLHDHSRVFNVERIEALELENMVEVGLAVITSALARHESRGAHTRVDYPERNDRQWLKHTLYSMSGTVEYKPVRLKPLSIDSFPPATRSY